MVFHVEKLKALMTRKNAINVVHWISVGSAGAAAIITAVGLPPSEKVAGLMTVGVILAFNQALQKFYASLQHQSTVAQAFADTIPLIQAAATGNLAQTNAVTAAVEALPHPAAVIQPVIASDGKQVIKEGSVLL